jgi:hypothetical protein
MFALRRDDGSAIEMPVGAMSDAVAAFFAALDRIEARNSQPTIGEDRVLHLAWTMLLSAVPWIATEVLQNLALRGRDKRAVGCEPKVKPIVEWRNDLRKFLALKKRPEACWAVLLIAATTTTVRDFTVCSPDLTRRSIRTLLRLLPLGHGPNGVTCMPYN